jgi:alpha-methylacyl-CoA racemase
MSAGQPDQQADVWTRGGPLDGLRVVELASIGPGPFGAMLLADLGADVLRIEGRSDPVGVAMDRRYEVMLRGRPVIDLNLKSPANVSTALGIIAQADVLIEGWRPGVAERLGVGPEDCFAVNRRLVYGRMTGWGQEGPLAHAAGHDINYIALTGALDMCGRAGQPPTPPLNLLGDFGGGGMLLALGVLAALHNAGKTGEGQIVDAAMLDGAALLTTVFWGLSAGGMWSGERGTNLVDTGAPFYDVYETADGKHIAIGAIEARFQSALYGLIGLSDWEADERTSGSDWPSKKDALTATFRQRSRDEWCALLEGADCCFAPVLSMEEAPLHEHNKSRRTFVEIDGISQPAPAPRFSRTPCPSPSGPSDMSGAAELLARWGVSEIGATVLPDLAATNENRE